MRWASLFSQLARQTWGAEVDDLARDAHGQHLAGVDEVGRGCLAGPVVVAAVILPPGSAIPGLDDSKHLTPERRQQLARTIRRRALAWSIIARGPERIDAINILAATREAATAAVDGLDPQPHVVITDALTLEGLTQPIVPVVRGDSLSMSIAAASVLAKVERDAIMSRLDRDFPHYEFARHKGYASETHLQALRRFGPCPAHRLTFAPVLPRGTVLARESAGPREAGVRQ